MNDPTASCTNGNATYTNRVLSVGTSDVTLPVVCWEVVTLVYIHRRHQLD